MLMIIFIIIFFITPHFDEVKFKRTDTLPSFSNLSRIDDFTWRLYDRGELVYYSFRLLRTMDTKDKADNILL